MNYKYDQNEIGWGTSHQRFGEIFVYFGTLQYPKVKRHQRENNKLVVAYKIQRIN
jgi:hypothetical protein